MNLHILPDDKYVNDYVACVEELAKTGSNIYLIRDAKPFRYLKGNYNYIEATVGSQTFNEHVNAAGRNDKIFLHFISVPLKKWLADFETSARIGWVYWGNDFYTNMLPHFDHFDPLTQAYIDTKIPKSLSRFWLLSEFRKYKRRTAKKKEMQSFLAQSIKAASKLSWVFHFMSGDFKLIQQYLKCPAEFVRFSYPLAIGFQAIEKTARASQTTEKIPYPKKLWVGNCGYPWVNHLDSFETIKNIKDDVAVYAPLSYGDAEYTQYVIKEGKKRFGERFIPLLDYMGFEDFVKLLYQMDLTVMGHNTPWAMSNINILLYFGKRAYIKPQVSSYRFFKERNVCVDNYYSFDPVKSFEPLPVEVIENNKRIILDEFSEERIKAQIKHMLEL